MCTQVQGTKITAMVDCTRIEEETKKEKIMMKQKKIKSKEENKMENSI